MPLRTAVSLALLLGLCGEAAATTLDPSLLHGLDLRMEAVPGQLRFEGMAVQAVHLAGPGVEQLLQRWLARRGRDAVRLESAAGWDIHSSVRDGRAEVLQVRRAGTGKEAIWSTTSLGGGRPPAGPRRLRPPPGCRVGPEVAGSDAVARFRQWTLRCSDTPERVLETLHAAAQRDGMRIASRWRRGLELHDERRGREFLVVALPTAAGTGVVVLERWQDGGGHP